VYHTNWTDYINDIKSAHADLTAAGRDLHITAQALKDLIGDQGGSPAKTAPTATSSGS
jgi:hypothetical protein